ncbi:MAG: hypothetical protein PHP23_12480 [Desulfobacterales bacterium]|nr:hypothetical protein [Desulfobacterales bacterium]MDD4073159.1 hypothetical protein [Desulfobacterales bacterium]MDD4392523.1 hypothetical protein [Desulfobacterales bacterium]
MNSRDDQILKTSKEIVVKFIELGRVSPTGFRDLFFDIYHTVKEAVTEPESSSDKPKQDPPS